MLGRNITQNRKVWHFLLFLMIVSMCVMYFTSKRKIEKLEANAAQIQQEKMDVYNEKEEIENQFQVEETRECIRMTVDVVEMKAKVDWQIERLEQKLAELRGEKNSICSTLRVKPDEAMNPYNYYNPVVQEDGVVVFE